MNYWSITIYGTLLIFTACNITGKLEESKKYGTEKYDTLEYKYSLIEGAKQKYLGNLKSAAALYQNAVKINPESGAANYELANLYEAHKLYEEAIHYAIKAYHLNPGNIYYGMLLGELYQQTDSLEEAAQVYRKLAEDNPRDNRLKYQLSSIYIALEKYDKALEIYRFIENEYGVSMEINLMKKELFVQMEAYDKALDEINKLENLKPGNENLELIRAEIYSEYRPQKAKAIYDSLNEVNGSVEVKIRSARFYLKHAHEQAFLDLFDVIAVHDSVAFEDKISLYLRITADTSFLRRHYQEISVILEKMESKYNQKLQVHTVMSDFYIKGNEYEKAIYQLKAVISFNNVNPVFYEQLITMFSMRNAFDSVIHYCSLALEKYEREAVFYYYKGVALLQQGKNKNAIGVLQSGLEASDNKDLNFQLYAYLGEAYYKDSNYDKSDKFYQKALQLDSMNTFVLNNYSYYLSLREEKLEYALSLSAKTLKEDSLNATYLDTYAWILYKLGKYEKAKSYIEKAVLFGAGNNPEVMEHYGDILYQLGNKEEAMEKWKDAQRFGGNSESLRKKINQIQD